MRYTNRSTQLLLIILLIGAACQPLQPVAVEPLSTVTVPGLGPVALWQNPAGLYAFVDVNVVTMAREEILSHQTVVVADKRIVTIAPVALANVPIDATLIDGAGRYLLPGLADMHLHLRQEYYLLLLLLNGVTTVRNMDGRPLHLAWRAQIASGQMLGPTIFTTGPILDEMPYYLPAERVLQKFDDVLANVAEQKRLGYDAIKVYDGLSGSAYNNVMAAARANHIEVVGHVPDGLLLLDVIEAGQRSVEHLDGYFNFYDDQMPTVLNELVAHAVWTVPTLTCFQLLKPTGETPTGLQAEMQALVPDLATYFDALPADFADRGYCYAPIWALKESMIARLAAAGAPMLLGTDAPLPYTVPGFAVHQELQNLVDVGLTPYAALRTATYNAALYLHQADQVGTVTVGQRADLLLVDANPLENIANLRQINGVMVQGRWLPREVIVEWMRLALE